MSRALLVLLLSASAAAAQTPAPAPSPSALPADPSAALAQQLGELIKEMRALRTEMTQLRQSMATLRQPPPGPPPAPPAPASVRLDNGPALGPEKAAVGIVEFSEFQCPFCRRHFEQTFPTLKQNYLDTGKVRYVFRNYPLVDIHPQAKPAALAAYCAGQQGVYWAMHDALFANQQRLGPPLYDELAQTLKLDVKKYQACREDAASAKAIEEDQKYGQSLGVQGTPHFFVGRLKGGQLVDVKRINGAQPAAAFTQALDELLKD
jgi:protein-disulfide isomerase